MPGKLHQSKSESGKEAKLPRPPGHRRHRGGWSWDVSTSDWMSVGDDGMVDTDWYQSSRLQQEEVM